MDSGLANLEQAAITPCVGRFSGCEDGTTLAAWQQQLQHRGRHPPNHPAKTLDLLPDGSSCQLRPQDRIDLSHIRRPHIDVLSLIPFTAKSRSICCLLGHCSFHSTLLSPSKFSSTKAPSLSFFDSISLLEHTRGSSFLSSHPPSTGAFFFHLTLHSFKTN